MDCREYFEKDGADIDVDGDDSASDCFLPSNWFEVRKLVWNHVRVHRRSRAPVGSPGCVQSLLLHRPSCCSSCS